MLVDRGGRMLPMAADYIGIPLETKPSEKVVVNLHEDELAQDFVSIETEKKQPKT